MEDAAADDGGQELLDEEDEEDAADGGEVEVVDEEEALELVGLAVAHPLAATEDDGIVDDDEDGGLLEGGHGGLALNESELAGRVAGDSCPGLVEDGPQLDAKGTVDGGQRQLLVEGGGRDGRHFACRGVATRTGRILFFLLVDDLLDGEHG